MLASGIKTIEVRKWNTNFRGSFYIHASKTVDIDVCEKLDLDKSNLVLGAIIGIAELINTKKYFSEIDFKNDFYRHFSFSEFSTKFYGFEISNPKKYNKPIKLPGKLGFFEVYNI